MNMHLARGAGLRWPLAAALVTALGAATTARADESLARYVPADVGLYVELRKAEDLLLPLIEPQLWVTLADLTGQPARQDESEIWRRRVIQTLGISPEAAVRRVFSERAALASQSWRWAGDSIVLGRAAAPAREVIRGWPARPLPSTGRAAVFQLPNNVGLVLLDDVLIFGDRGSRQIFPTALQLLEAERGQRLSENPAYVRLLEDVPFKPDGIIYVRLGGAEQPATAPATAPAGTPPNASPPATMPSTAPTLRSWLPGPLNESQHVLLALKRHGRLLHFSAVGDAPAVHSEPPRRAHDLITSLPRETLAAWAGGVDFERLLDGVEQLPERHALRVFYEIHVRAETLPALIGNLEHEVCVALGTARRAAIDDTTPPPIPALALIVPIRDPNTAIRELRTVVQSTLSLYKLLTLRRGGATPIPVVETHVAGDLVVEQLDLSPLLERAFGPAAANTVQIVWTVDESVLVIATHLDWLADVIAARHNRDERLGDEILALNGLSGVGRDAILLAQTRLIAELGSQWIEYLRQQAPDVLSESWWRRYQPEGSSPRLGVQVAAESDARRLVVQSVTRGSPADGAIQPGDAIVGVNRKRFATSQPVDEILRGVDARPDARWVDLLVERERIVRVRRLALPFVDPVTVLQRLIAIGQLVDRVAYAEHKSGEQGPRGHLLIELGDRVSVPAGHAATTAPATAPAAN
jgi:hypothetical protein